MLSVSLLITVSLSQWMLEKVQKEDLVNDGEVKTYNTVSPIRG